ncbi:hypothetical protein MMC17_006085 [Xylographa soralifera]|nr:hypothetical protein [Xylographa soralifera]
MAFAKVPPMTSRQAKKAYRQASGPRLTVAEQKRIERKAVLLEREQKAKEKERNKIANKKKRLEKEEKAKEQRKGMGIIEEGYVSPRQIRLAAYFVKIDKQDEDADCRKEEKYSFKECDLPRPCLEENVVRGGAQNITLGTPSCLPPQELNLSDNDWASYLPTNTQVERELSGGNSTAPAFAAKEDTDQLGSSHSEHFGLQKAIASASDLKSNTCRQSEDLSQTMPFSTQDLEFSTDELTELMSPAKFSEVPSSLTGTSSARHLSLLSSANGRADSAPHSDHIDNGNDGTSVLGLTKKSTAPLHQRASSRRSQHTMFNKPAVASKLPEVDNHITHPSPCPKVTESSTRKSYVLADREVVPGHAKYVLDRVSRAVSTKKIPKVFGNPTANSMRPPNRKPLGDSKGNTTRVAWNKLAAPSSKDELKNTTLQSSENRRPNNFENTSAGFDFGDSFLSTQELLDYVA